MNLKELKNTQQLQTFLDGVQAIVSDHLISRNYFDPSLKIIFKLVRGNIVSVMLSSSHSFCMATS